MYLYIIADVQFPILCANFSGSLIPFIWRARERSSLFGDADSGNDIHILYCAHELAYFMSEFPYFLRINKMLKEIFLRKNNISWKLNNSKTHLESWIKLTKQINFSRRQAHEGGPKKGRETPLTERKKSPGTFNRASRGEISYHVSLQRLLQSAE